MKKAFVLLVALFVAAPTIAAVITLSPPTTYTDSTPIPAAKIPLMVYTPMWGPTNVGQGTWPNVGSPGAPGVTTLNAPDPATGATYWYTVIVTLDNVSSGKGAAKSKTVPFPPKTPGLPGVEDVQ